VQLVVRGEEGEAAAAVLQELQQAQCTGADSCEPLGQPGVLAVPQLAARSFLLASITSLQPAGAAGMPSDLPGYALGRGCGPSLGMLCQLDDALLEACPMAGAWGTGQALERVGWLAKLARWDAERERRQALHSSRLVGRVRRAGRYEHYLPRAVPGLSGDSIAVLQAFGAATAAGGGSGSVG
jgi:hypothetical protein